MLLLLFKLSYFQRFVVLTLGSTIVLGTKNGRFHARNLMQYKRIFLLPISFNSLRPPS